MKRAYPRHRAYDMKYSDEYARSSLRLALLNTKLMNVFHEITKNNSFSVSHKEKPDKIAFYTAEHWRSSSAAIFAPSSGSTH